MAAVREPEHGAGLLCLARDMADAWHTIDRGGQKLVSMRCALTSECRPLRDEG